MRATALRLRTSCAQAKSRGANYNLAERLELIDAYVDVGQDVITGSGQTAADFSLRIFRRFLRNVRCPSVELPLPPELPAARLRMTARAIAPSSTGRS